MGVNQKETPNTPPSLTYISPSARNGLSAPSAHVVSAAGCTTTPVQKPSTPLIHSTAWRRLVFEEAPPNILHAVSTIPYASGSDKPLWEYDPEGNLKEKCKFVAAVGQGVAITEDNLMTQCHGRRVRHILRDTRKQVNGYLKAHQVLRSERYRRLQWSEIASKYLANIAVAIAVC
ncbi:hypothetical protein PHYSODRAFT_476355 [Phytophthora sojae]|uniref:Uncharacterized protein n=1 Tax=Phytophthora sojae (strain P6497) TaxID=1094619 RepID=G4YQ82_PHYSP|nr:hypothetical protein PHYSODRAFT_476355 [Phytophthora sojae]EGZ29586.1 hypothetical protein PHYSODRAFT_476355 [Phytophthora sojae]|eukprot:XP_009516861.1 hypothetical protein PHYSODRAFT_476355 [Phytophthora sojae]